MADKPATPTQEPISVGDLVQVVRPVCGCGSPSVLIGRIFVVTRIRTKRADSCRGCGRGIGDQIVADGLPHKDDYVSTWRLKRIPPLPELEGEKQKEDIREPA